MRQLGCVLESVHCVHRLCQPLEMAWANTVAEILNAVRERLALLQVKSHASVDQQRQRLMVMLNVLVWPLQRFYSNSQINGGKLLFSLRQENVHHVLKRPWGALASKGHWCKEK